jgi:hypothetical protein
MEKIKDTIRRTDVTDSYGTFLAEYYGRDNGRTASLYTSWQGYSVVFYKDGEVIERRSLWDHNRDYAEDACENWILEIIK